MLVAPLPSVTAELRKFSRNLLLKLSLESGLFPTCLMVNGVECTNRENFSAGGFADVYCGTLNQHKVALKRLRAFQMVDGSTYQKLKKVMSPLFHPRARLISRLQAFFRESLVWMNLSHDNILPFIGVTEGIFHHTLCMVLPWMEYGNIHDYVKDLKQKGELVGKQFIDSVNRWVGCFLIFLCCSDFCVWSSYTRLPRGFVICIQKG